MQGLCQVSWRCPVLQELSDIEHSPFGEHGVGKMYQKAVLKEVRLAEGKT